MLFIFVFGEVRLESLCQFTPREHDAPRTAFAFESDVRAETDDGPFVGAARMLFAESQVVVEAEVGEHGGISYQLSVNSEQLPGVMSIIK